MKRLALVVVVLLVFLNLGSSLKTGKQKSKSAGGSSKNAKINQLLSVDDLKKLISSKDFDHKFRLLEANLKPESQEDYKKEHIPKSIYFDAMKGAKSTKLSPVNFPEKEPFRDYLKSLGLSNSHHIIIYDRSDTGLFDSTRTWWVFKIYGHDKLSILKGGFKEWKHKMFNLTNQTTSYPSTNFTLSFRKQRIRNFKEVHSNVKSKKELVIDARDKEEFNKAHIPNAVNLPFTDLFVNGSTQLKDSKKLRSLFESKHIKQNRPIIVSCMKGLRAAAMGFVMNLLGFDKVALYPGSWLEYSQQLEALKNSSTTSTI